VLLAARGLVSIALANRGDGHVDRGLLGDGDPSSPTDAGFAGWAGVGDRDRRLHPAPECSTCH
jgi:hypothetical protein